MSEQHYDLLVIGAGAAGSTAATTAASQGKRVVLIERDKIGGTCLNYGCDPTKTLLHTAQLLYQAQHANTYGLAIPTVSTHWDEVQKFVQQVIVRIRGGTSEEASAKLAQQGITVMHKTARFLSPHSISTGEDTVTADRIIIATGSKTSVPSIDGLQETGFITNIEAVSLPVLPRRLAVVGGGPIGIEFAQMFHRFGVEVTVLERSPQLLDKEDRELADKLCDLLTHEGLHLLTGTELRRVERVTDGKRLTYRCNNAPQDEILIVDEILLAIGRRPALEALQLEVAAIKTNKKGIEVGETLRTNVEHIWAAGDVTGGYQFTHVAYEQGKIAAHNAFADTADAPQRFTDRVIPWVTYTYPTLSHVGKTEEQLKQEGVAYKVGRMQFSSSERAIAEGHTEGLVKLLLDKQGKLLGGHILGTNADNLIAPIVVAMQNGITAEQLATTILPYPTMSEAVRWAADSIHRDE